MYDIKCTFLGDTGVGKTSIARTYFENNFKEKHEITLGASFWNKHIPYKDNKLDLQVWDTAGQERYRSLTPMYIRNSKFVILVYDISNKLSLESLNEWLNIVKNTCYNNLPKIIVIANKVDLNFDYKYGKNFADSIGSKFFFTSAKKQKNIEEIFEYIINESKLLYDTSDNTNTKTNLSIYNTDIDDKTKSCCNII